MTTLMELDIDRVGDDIRLRARGERGEQTAPRSLGAEHGALAMLRFAASVQRAASRGAPLAPALLAEAQSIERAVLGNDISSLLAQLSGGGNEPLVVRLSVHDPELQSVAWEALCKPGEALGFWASSPDLLPVRGVTSSEPWQPREVQGAVRVLAIAPTSEHGLSILKEALATRIASGEVEWLDPLEGAAASVDGIFERLRREPAPHVLHFLGHGGLDKGLPALSLADDEDGDPRSLQVELLAQQLRASFRGVLKLVILEACEGARPSAFASAAEILARAGASAVVAHLWPVKADVARAFSTRLYRVLARSGDIAVAMNEARRAILGEFEGTAEALSPVLYLRGPNGVIFDFQSRSGARRERAAARTIGASAVVPAYESPAIRALAEQIDAARAERDELLKAGASAADVEAKILDLRRKLREGGRLRAGDSLADGRYLLVESLGRGGYSSVWRAFDRERGELVAVKVLHADQAGDPVRRERFFRGARVMATLNHKAVVRVLDPGAEDGDHYYFVMELAPGGDLHRAITAGTVDRERALSILLDVSGALAEAHAKGIVHRDVKPGNILLDSAGAPRLTDFDLVDVGDVASATNSAAGGSYLYMAPEQAAKGRRADARADIYGLGMTALFCLYGGDLPAIVLRRPDKVIGELACSRAVKAVVMRAIDVDPDGRFANASALCEALRAAIEVREDPSSSAGRAPTPAGKAAPTPRTRVLPDSLVAVLPAGAVFHGRYRVVRCINAGSMGAVYEVLDTVTDSLRALKVMLPSITKDADLRSRFEREAKVTGAIKSDHIVRVSDAGVDAESGTPFLVMDLLEGEDLGTFVRKRGALRPTDVILFLTQVALALDKTHAKGIIHRDLKPENIFVTERDDGSPCVKLLDFGIAKVTAESHQAARATRPVGTPLYMAPEQIRGDVGVGAATDVHAIGHIAYTLLTGEPYWADEADTSTMYALLSLILAGTREAPSARSLRRCGVELPAAFDDWFQKAIATEASERFASASTAVAALGAALGDGAPPGEATAWKRPSRFGELHPAAPTVGARPTSRVREAPTLVSAEPGPAFPAVDPAKDSAGVVAMGVGGTVPLAATPDARSRRRRDALLVAITAALVVGLAVIGAITRQRSSVDPLGAEPTPEHAASRAMSPLYSALAATVSSDEARSSPAPPVDAGSSPAPPVDAGARRISPPPRPLNPTISTHEPLSPLPNGGN